MSLAIHKNRLQNAGNGIIETTRKVKVISLPETIKEKIDVSSEGPSLGVSSGGRGKTTRVFIRVNTKTSRDKIKANQMDFIKTKCKQRNVNHIAKYDTK